MLSRSNTVLWMQQDESESSHQNNNNNNNGANHNQQQLVVDPTARVEAVNDMANSLSSFKSMLDVDDDGDHNWFLPHTTHHHQNNQLTFSTNHQVHHHNRNNLGLLQQVLPVDSCNSSCSPSSASVFNNNNNNNPLLDPSQVHYFLPPKPSLHSILNPLDPSSSFDLGGILTGFNDLTSSQTHLGSPNLTHPDPHLSHFSTTHLLQLPTTTTNAGNGFGSPGFPGFEEGSGTSSLFLNRSKLLKPLDNFASIGAQPTLFQKRAALRKNLTHEPNTCNFGGELAANDKKRKSSTGSWDDMDNLSFDGSGMGYDSDDFTENNITNSKFDQESVKNGGTSSNPNSTITGGVGDQKGGKKKGLPAKNLMAERRRRKKLNDRLYMLRSVVPKISKMDRASILGDAIEYLKELLQKINDLHNELEATPASSSLTPTTGFYPLTPTPPTLPGRIKEELCPSSLPSPTGQPARVEVRLREGRAVNIHMFCNRRPGLLLSTMKALDNLGLDIQQAVISCFNGFALDIFRAEQCKEGQDVHPDQIKAVLLDSAGFHGMV